jgi:hypothetical protein
MTVKVNGKEFKDLKSAQDYATELKADPNYVPPVKEEKPTIDEGAPDIVPDPSIGFDPAAEGSDKTVETIVHRDSEGNVYVPCEAGECDPSEAQQAFDAAPTDEVLPSDVELVDVSDIADSLTDEDPELAEELNAIADEANV